MTLSIVILTLNSEKIILNCLNAIEPSCPNYDYEIIIVDNGSNDSTLTLIESNYPECKLLKNKSNLGVAKARNIGIQEAEGNFLLILDDDVVMHPLSLDKLIRRISHDSTIGMIAPQLLNPDDTIQYNGLPFPSILVKTRRIISKLLGKSINNPYSDFINKKEPYEPDYLIGAVQLIRKELFDKVGLLDETIFYGPEDADLCVRIHQAHYRVICIPSINMTHNYQRRSYKLKQLPLLIKHLQSLIYFWFKHPGLRKTSSK
ncbi:glycosyltransferase family 2 protein [Carboxylicivirga sp. N1Y90]|uniref:glycosyltransferase family 2 protein n=1 Tax=Carboxylicivirga fragile TaxID=3417571 RepID=UPI003D34079B|nr:glycosyltransferase family 2 protein [Marinilabiliaceae bacterium N1Y90]